MTDLSKLPWGELKLPDWEKSGESLRLFAHDSGKYIHVRIANGGAVAQRHRNGPWCILGYASGSGFSDLEKLRSICRRIDAFIEEHSKPQQTQDASPERLALQRLLEASRQTREALADDCEWSMAFDCARAALGEVKAPDVVPPSGHKWTNMKIRGVRGAERTVLLSSDGRHTDLPVDASHRDAMLACCEAADPGLSAILSCRGSSNEPVITFQGLDKISLVPGCYAVSFRRLP